MNGDPVRYSRGRDQYDAHPENRAAQSWVDFRGAILADVSARKGLAYITAPMRANGDGRPHRGKADALNRSWLAFDFDQVESAEVFVRIRLWFAAQWQGFGYFTASSTPEAPRARIILAADREMTPQELERVCLAIHRDVTAAIGPLFKLDPSVYQSEQAVFTPTAGAQSFILDGDAVDVDQVLATAPDAGRRSGGTTERATEAEARDPVVKELDRRGMLIRHVSPGRLAIICPFEPEHSSTTSDTSTVYLLPCFAGVRFGKFHCLHSHCKGRPQEAFIQALELDPHKVWDAQAGKQEAPPGGPAEAVDGWPAPVDLFRTMAPAPFEFEGVPPAIARIAKAATNARGFDQSGIIVAAVVAVAAAIDDRYRLAVRPGAEWFESARLWAVLIGGPSTGKSPTIRTATDALKDLHSELFAQWARDNTEESTEAKPAIYTSDATTEALSDVLRDNPRGVLMLTEEFASWIGSIDAYRDGAGAKSRGEWLQLYDGGPHQINRVKRGSFLVPNWGASVLAACTPAGLRDQVKKLPDDGLIHRFIPAIMRTPTDEIGASMRNAASDWSRLLRDVFARTTSVRTYAALRFSVSGQMAFDAEVKGLRHVVEALAEASPALASHVGKHAGILARVCLVFHVVDSRQGNAIEPDTVALAVRFMGQVRQHAALLYQGILATAPSVDLARSLARALAAARPVPEAVGRNWLTQGCRAFRFADDNARRMAVSLLEDCNWLAVDPVTRSYGGWSASTWLVNPQIAQRFSEQGAIHRAKRDAIRAAMGGGG